MGQQAAVMTPFDKTNSSTTNAQSSEDILADLNAYFDGRNLLRQDFLDEAGWANASIDFSGEDGSARRFLRIKKGLQTVILMESVPDDADQTIPGHKMVDWTRLNPVLKHAGVRVPEIIAADLSNGYVLMEDFGDISFRMVYDQEKVDGRKLYGLAVDALHNLNAVEPQSLNLPDFFASPLYKAINRVVGWYMPAVREKQNEDGLVESFESVWKQIVADLPKIKQSFLHCDYHVENLMWLKGEQGTDRCGIIDFQGAMVGPAPYDLVNILEDARLILPKEFKAKMLEEAVSQMSATDREAYLAWYHALSFHFHARVIGQFIKLYLVDGKARYLQYLPLLQEYMRQDLAFPELTPMKQWFAGHGFSFDQDHDINFDAMAQYIAKDAF